MIERRPIITFLVIAFVFSWIFFLIPLSLTKLDIQTRQYATLGLLSLGMWGPGIAAMIATKFVAKQPLSALHLNTLGPKRFYLWAWLLPLLIVILAGLLTVLFGIAEFDKDFTTIRSAMANAPGAENIEPWVVVLAQIGIAIFLAPFFNVLFALGEEMGWRGFLLPRLEPLGQWKAILFTGIIWGIWHAPVIVQGQNYPGYPIAGIFMMIVFCVLLGAILAWLYFNTRSPWVAALGHGSVNAVAGLPIVFYKSGFNMAFGGTIATFPAWIGMAIFITWLVWTKRLPVRNRSAEMAAG